MVHRWLIAQVVFVGLLAVLAFPGEGSAVRPQFVISLTSDGASPAVLKTEAGLGPVFFSNTDTVTHTIAFANGACSMQVSAGSSEQCPSTAFMGYAGDYAYTVDGTRQGQLDVEAVGRSVSLVTRSHSVGRGSRLRLHGRLEEANSNWSPPGPGSPQPIIVLARPDRYHAFHRIAVVRAKVIHPIRTNDAPFGRLLWQLHVRPRATTIYMAEANYQPQAGRVWQRAWSKPFRVRVGR